MRLLRIQAQPVGAHPCGDVSDAVGELADGVLGAVYRTIDIRLTIVGVEVGTRSMHSYNAEDLSGIEQEYERAQHGALRNSPE